MGGLLSPHFFTMGKRRLRTGLWPPRGCNPPCAQTWAHGPAFPCVGWAPAPHKMACEILGKDTVRLHRQARRPHGTAGGELLSYFLSFPAESVPLTKVKSMRESLRERQLLRDYLQRHPYSQAYKLLRQPRVTVQPLRNYLDVSVAGAVHSLP